MKDRIVSLDMLRGFAAISVATPHAWLYLGSGGLLSEAISAVAVEIFFVLSGFVLAPQILLVLGGKVRFGLGTFLVRRWIRTIPPYLVALIFVSVILDELGSADFWRYAFYVQNFVAQHTNKDYYSIAWSLSVEEWFYITFPLFLIAASLGRGRSSRFYFTAAVCFISAASLARTVFGDPLDWDDAVRRVVLFRVDAIAWGFVLYIACQSRQIRNSGLLAIAAIASGACALALVSHATINHAAQNAFPFAAAIFGSACITLCLALEPYAKRIATLAGVAGRLSYPIYLFHFVVLYAISDADISSMAKFAIFAVATPALAAVSAYLFEAPLLEMRPGYRRKHEVAIS